MGQGPFGNWEIGAFFLRQRGRPGAAPRRANFMSCVMLLGGRLWPPKVDRTDRP